RRRQHYERAGADQEPRQWPQRRLLQLGDVALVLLAEPHAGIEAGQDLVEVGDEVVEGGIPPGDVGAQLWHRDPAGSGHVRYEVGAKLLTACGDNAEIGSSLHRSRRLAVQAVEQV